MFLGGFGGFSPQKKKATSATKARAATEHRQPGRPHSTTDTRRDHSDPKPGTRKAEPTNQSPKRPGRRSHKRPAPKASRPPPTTSSPKPPQETSSSRTRSTAKTNDPARSTRPRKTDNKHSQHPQRDKRRTTASPRRARAPPSKAGWRRPQGCYCTASTALALVGPDEVPAYNGKTRARGGPRLARAAIANGGSGQRYALKLDSEHELFLICAVWCSRCVLCLNSILAAHGRAADPISKCRRRRRASGWVCTCFCGRKKTASTRRFCRLIRTAEKNVV